MTRKNDRTFKDFVLDQLSGPGVEARAMFGGYGLYHGARFFGIVFKGRVFFKTDRDTRSLYEERGMKPFQPGAKQTLKNYYEVPADVLEDTDELVDWAKKAAAAG